MNPAPIKKTRLSSQLLNFNQECKCDLHDATVGSNEHVLVRNIKNKDYSKKHLDWLKEHGFFPPKGSHICDGCLRFAKIIIEKESKKKGQHLTAPQELQSTTTSTHNDDDTVDTLQNLQCTDEHANNEYVDTVLNLLKNNKLTDESVNKLCLGLGNSLSGTIYKDSETVAHQYRDISESTNVDCSTFIRQRPSCVTNLLKGLISKDGNDNLSKKKLYSLCLLIEQLYVVRNANFVGPFAFSQGIVKWTLHGSNLAHSLDGATTASGSMKTLKSRFKETSNIKNTCFESGDIDVFADNVQKIGRTTRVRNDGTTPMNVATNVVYIQSDPPTSYQESDDLKPGNWFGNTPPQSLSHQMNDLEEDLKSTTFRPFKSEQQRNVLTKIVEESNIDNLLVTDHVTSRMRVNREGLDEIVCPKCGLSSNCDYSGPCSKCGNEVHRTLDRTTLYGTVPSQHPDKPPFVQLGEIVDGNPNSSKTVKALLQNLAGQADVGKRRKWIRVGFDGVPYNIAASLIDNVVVCNVCGAEVDTKKQPFAQHIQSNHPGQTDIGHKLLFDYILLTPGAGHIEINLLRAIFKLCKHICLWHIADRLGFKSKAAKEFVITGSNHHVTWQIFYIMFQAFARELAHEYFCECVRNGRIPSQKDWARWRDEDVRNPNYHLMYDLVFHYFMGILAFRCGVRKNNHKVMLAGRQEVAPIMFIGKHRLYRKLLVRDMQIRIEAPTEIKDYMERNEAFSKSGDTTRGQGGDYVTEEENRDLKTCLPPGMPTLQSWQWASRCQSFLKQNRMNVLGRAGVTDAKHQSQAPIFNFEEEVQNIRADIRQSSMLKPLEQKPLTSLDGVQLHPELVNMHLTLCSNYNNYKQSSEASLEPIFVTIEDEIAYNDVQAWTKDKIVTKTREFIDDIADVDLGLYYNKMLSDLKKSTRKSELIHLYEEVSDALKDEIKQQVVNVDDNSMNNGHN